MVTRPVTLAEGTITVRESVARLEKQVNRMAKRVMTDAAPEGGLTYEHAARSMAFDLRQLQALEITLQAVIVRAQANATVDLHNPNLA